MAVSTVPIEVVSLGMFYTTGCTKEGIAYWGWSGLHGVDWAEWGWSRLIGGGWRVAGYSGSVGHEFVWSIAELHRRVDHFNRRQSSRQESKHDAEYFSGLVGGSDGMESAGWEDRH